MSEAPDFAEPVLGYRAWVADTKGRLKAVTMGSAWTPGTNLARCALGLGDSHLAPHPRCACGLYGLHSWSDRRLLHDNLIVGAIAAWGRLEVHKTGFRAERACVLALARPARGSGAALGRVEAAANRYGVQVVELADLELIARRFASPLEVPADPKDEFWRQPVVSPARPPGLAARIAAGPELVPVGRSRGTWVPRHVVVECDETAVTLYPAAAITALIEPDSTLTLVAAGSRVLRGDPVALVRRRHHDLVICSPFEGEIKQVNDRLARHPSLLGGMDPRPRWIARIEVRREPAASCPVIWGAEARRAYRAHVATLDDLQIAESLSLERHLAWAGVGSFGELAVALRTLAPSRPRPALATAADLAAAIDDLERWVEADAGLRARLIELGLTATFEVRDPRGRLTLAAAEGSRRLVVRLAAEQFHAFWSGRLELAGAIDAGRGGDGGAMLLEGTRGEALLVASVLQRLFERYRRRADQIETAHTRARQAVGSGGWAAA